MVKFYSYKIISSKVLEKEPNKITHNYESETFSPDEVKNLKISRFIVEGHEKTLEAIPGSAVLKTSVDMIVEDPTNL